MLSFTTFDRSEILRFIIVGGLATLTHITISFICVIKLQIHTSIANVLGYSFAVLISYVGNYHFTFKSNAKHKNQFPKFFFVSISGLLISSFITYITCSVFEGSITIAMSLVVIFVPLSTFVTSKFWVFRNLGTK